jgi:hypothetical protein
MATGIMLQFKISYTVKYIVCEALGFSEWGKQNMRAEG